jgi:O-antigen/teichoic acid export membrane protein
VITVTSGLRGILEATQRFRVLNLIRIPASIFLFVGPLFVLPFSSSLVPVTAVLVVGRGVAGIAYLIAGLQAIPALAGNLVFDRRMVVPVVKFGGWMTVSNVISPVMAYLDRFGIGALLSLGAVAYYTAPFDTVTRVLVIPAAATSVLFPAFAFTLAQNRDRCVFLLARGIKYVFLAVLPLALAVIAMAPELLRLWLGAAFAEHGSRVLQWLAVGVFLNALAHLPYALIQGAGRPDITAKLHFAELPFYLAAVWLLTKRFGIEGTAIAWTGRVGIDALLLYLLAGYWLPHGSKLLTAVGSATATGLILFYLATWPSSLPWKLGFLVLSLAVFAALSWFWALGSGERSFLLRTGKASAARPHLTS